ncbi:hypothetical protein Agub_g12805, partial [Astrephomene gubernaculifera]
LAAALAAPEMEALALSTSRTTSAPAATPGVSLTTARHTSTAAAATTPSSSTAPTPSRPSFCPPPPPPLPAPARPLPSLRILRSSQADALRLDAELGGMLQEQLGRLFEHFTPGQAARFEPEVQAVMAAMVFWLSVWSGRATPGSELLNMRYRNERAVAAGPVELVGASGVEGPGLSRVQRVVLGLGSVVLPYAWTRLCRAAHAADWGAAASSSSYDDDNNAHDAWVTAPSNQPSWDSTEGNDHEGSSNNSSLGSRLLSRFRSRRGGQQSSHPSWRQLAWRAMRWSEGALHAAALLHSWAFLVRGDYRTLLERVVGARLVWRRAVMSRVVSFEYLNRQLLWEQVAEVVMLLLPALDLARMRRALGRLLPRPAGAGGSSGGTQLPPPKQPEQQQQQQEASAPAHHDEDSPPPPPPPPPACCPVCDTPDMLTAVRALPCGHPFCYYCLRSHTQADPGYCCPSCGVRVAAMR